MIKEPYLHLFDLAICLSDACDLISPLLAHHHKQVACIAFAIGKELGLDHHRLEDLVLAAIMHDIGALSLHERIELMEFETANTSAHEEIGYSLLNQFKPTQRIAEIVREHHRHWDGMNAREESGSSDQIESDIIHCADRVALLIDIRENVIGQAGEIRERITAKRGTMFRPDVHDAFVSVSDRESFWLDAVSPTIYRTLRKQVRMGSLMLDGSQLNDLAMVFGRIIDFRSRFTATHSAGVAAVAEMLSKAAGFSKRESGYMRIAGLLHDLGKLAVPREILEKPGKLESREFDVIRTHTYHTFRILDTLDGFDTINMWGAFHHERLNGKGYPFHHTDDNLSLGSRIMCVADIFTAIIEDRPYRSGMAPEEVVNVLVTMAKHGFIDTGIVELLKSNFTAVNGYREQEQNVSRSLYERMFGTQR